MPGGGGRYFEGVHILVPEALKQLGLETTPLPYVNQHGVAYLRGTRVKLADLAAQLGKIYNLHPNEEGFDADTLYNRTIVAVSLHMLAPLATAAISCLPQY